jgi:hypothetical protein
MTQNAPLSSGSTPNQMRAIKALARGETISRAAVAAKVDRRTLYRWLHEEAEFLAAGGTDNVVRLAKRREPHVRLRLPGRFGRRPEPLGASPPGQQDAEASIDSISLI